MAGEPQRSSGSTTIRKTTALLTSAFHSPDNLSVPGPTLSAKRAVPDMDNSDEIRPRHKGQHQVLRVPQGLWTSHGQLYTTEKRERILNTTRIPLAFHISGEPTLESGPKSCPESEPGPDSTTAASANDDSAPATPGRDPCDLGRIRGRRRI